MYTDITWIFDCWPVSHCHCCNIMFRFWHEDKTWYLHSFIALCKTRTISLQVPATKSGTVQSLKTSKRGFAYWKKNGNNICGSQWVWDFAHPLPLSQDERFLQWWFWWCGVVRDGQPLQPLLQFKLRAALGQGPATLYHSMVTASMAMSIA